MEKLESQGIAKWSGKKLEARVSKVYSFVVAIRLD